MVEPTGHCPYLGLKQNQAIRFASPTPEHRCYAAGQAQEIPTVEPGYQTTYCLSPNHTRCPLYTGSGLPSTPPPPPRLEPALATGGGVRGWFAGLTPRDRAIYGMLVGLLALILLFYAIAGVVLARGGLLFSNGAPAATAQPGGAPGGLPAGDPSPSPEAATATAAPTEAPTLTAEPSATARRTATARATARPSPRPTRTPAATPSSAVTPSPLPTIEAIPASPTLFVPPPPTRTPAPPTPTNTPSELIPLPPDTPAPTEAPTDALVPTEAPTAEPPTPEPPTAAPPAVTDTPGPTPEPARTP